MYSVLITGASGLIGRELTNVFLNKNYNVKWVVRNRPENVPHNVRVYLWNPNLLLMDDDAIKDVDIIINLAGCGIADKRWTLVRKREILESRILSVKTLGNLLKRTSVKLKHFIGASAVGYYGLDTTRVEFTENDSSGKDFLANVCVKWEQTYLSEIAPFCENLSVVRIGMVLSNKGGALPKMILPFKYYFGSYLGSGKQWMPWIHIYDLVNVFVLLANKSLPPGIYNGVAPEFVNNKQFSETLASALHKPLLPLGVPAFLLKILLGEMSVMVLKGNKVSAKKLLDNKFHFQFPQLSLALNHLVDGN